MATGAAGPSPPRKALWVSGQQEASGKSKWKKIGTYRTRGAREKRLINVPGGKYRVVIYDRQGYKGSKTEVVRIKR